MLRRILIVFLILTVLTGNIYAGAGASSNAQQFAAERLYALGLFQGIGSDGSGNPDFALENTLTRVEAVVMTIRLMGRDTAAKWSNPDGIPFTDVPVWAKPYVMYAYTHGITSGVSSNTFSAQSNIKATHYLTFVLRAIGYTDGEDFKSDSAQTLTDKLGITHGEYKGNEILTRGNAAEISYAALYAQMDDGLTLYDHLKKSGAIRPPVELSTDAETIETVNTLADGVLIDLKLDGLSVEKKAQKIYNWVKGHVTYVSTGEKNGVYYGALNAFKLKKGDCYTFYAISEVLLTRAGVVNIGVTRVGGRTSHYWSLIRTENGLWYHYDSTPHSNQSVETYLFTETRAVALTGQWGNNYYTYEHTLYPEVTA